MTDMSILLQMLERIKAPMRVYPEAEGAGVIIEIEAAPANDGPIRGYAYFETHFHFKGDGSLNYIGIWE